MACSLRAACSLASHQRMQLVAPLQDGPHPPVRLPMSKGMHWHPAQSGTAGRWHMKLVRRAQDACSLASHQRMQLVAPLQDGPHPPVRLPMSKGMHWHPAQSGTAGRWHMKLVRRAQDACSLASHQ
eukprot:CAMPEP_0115192066 /NCGR_PEP_ID=MMETSP0270-20121206/12851_1 /TAXON_ID=71861 /ORGANISM="Scrippsiella trochoidea, Strain CCMP3099" /LENGTH=125 /DNA_ID=CAMNT_0002605301 /DNA_START=923 /DNA_END=1297 /DNA_ORIENTATION=-